nr:fimbria/pilus periplasmic chaperone [Paraburkholderia tagetis]
MACAHPMQEAVASSFIASPVTFDLTPNKPTSILRLTNNGENDLRLQVHAVKWGTDGYDETQVDTDEIILNPPVFTIKPGQQQFLRFGLRSVTQTAKEQSYRLIVDEIPDETSVVENLGIRTALRVSIPVFINPMQKNERVTWHFVKKDNRYVLVAENGGNVHIKINGFVIVDGSGTPVFRSSNLAYVMPEQRKEWPLMINHSLDRITLKLNTQTGQSDEVLSKEVQ